MFHLRLGLAVAGMLSLLVPACPAGAQGFLSPGARAIPPVGQQSTSPAAPGIEAPAAPPPSPGRSLPSLRLPASPALPDTMATPEAEAGAAQRRPALPASRPLPARTVLPPADAAVQLRGMIELAAVRSPELASAPSRQAALAARAAAAGSITPAPPSAGGGFVSDGFNNRRGGREIELSVATPLWLPGEGTASVQAATAASARLSAQGQAQRLAVAGQVREALAAVALAEVELAGAEIRLRDAGTLEADVARRVRGRDAAESELLTARLDRLEAEVARNERRATLDGARLVFTALTGVEPNTAALNETVPAASSAERPAHPQLFEADAAMAAAEANRRLTGLQSRDSPEIGVIGRSERDPGSNRFDTRAGLQFRLPFATEARNAPRRAAAEADVTEAAVAAVNVRRQVDLGVEQARIQLAAVSAGLDAARQRIGVLRQQRGLAEAAFRAGQIGLADAIRVRAVVTDSEVAQARAEIAVRQGRSRLRQAMGLLP